ECTTSTAESDTGDVSVIVRCTSKGAGAAYCSCGGGFSEIPPEYGGPQPGGAAPAGPATGSDTCNFAAPGVLASLMNAYLDTPTAPDGSDLFETVLSQACANKVCADPGPHFGQECEYVAGGTDLAKRCRCPGGSCAPADPSCPGGEPPAGSVTGQEPEVAGGAAEGEEEVVAGTQPDAGVVAG
ncbi:MAG TPA: hypothetical protein VJB16_05720, partial [archaeon]|nr:hypothetical protein [archaeon]